MNRLMLINSQTNKPYYLSKTDWIFFTGYSYPFATVEQIDQILEDIREVVKLSTDKGTKLRGIQLMEFLVDCRAGVHILPAGAH